MTNSQSLAVLATIVSAVFFVGGKVLMARYRMPWPQLWRWSLMSSSACGLAWYLLLGAPSLPWEWCLAAGCAGALAHVAANQAMAWGDASLLVPISGAKPLVLIPLLPLVLDRSMPPGLMHACWVATLGVALTGLAPRRVHLHAPRPTAAFLLMTGSLILMGMSDVCGAKATEVAGPALRYPSIALWTATLGVIPGLSWIVMALRATRLPPVPAPSPEVIANRVRAVVLGVIFAAFIALLALAFAVAADPGLAVAEVSVVVAFRGVVAVLLVLALDRWLGMGLEPLPWWVHALRLSGALVLGVAVVLAYR